MVMAKKFSLLVVDDNEMNRELLQRRLESFGHLVSVAEDGRRALERLTVEQYDLVLLDIMMPEIDGYEVLKTMRANPKHKNTPVMMVTAVNDTENVVRCINMGANDFVAKPFDPSVLKTRVTKLLEKRAKAAGGDRESINTGAPGTVLVVDDSDTSRKIISGQLKQLGYEVVQAEDGASGIATAKQVVPDTILLDVIMPELDGIEVLQRLKNDDVTKNIPVIMLSANDDSQMIAACMSAGALDYIVKPFNSILLRMRLGAVPSRNVPSGTPSRGEDDLKRKIVAEVRRQMLSNSLDLPVVSDIATTITQLTSNDGVGIVEIAQLIKTDAAITAKLLSIANSNFYRSLTRIDNLNDALMRIGLNEARRYVLAMVNRNAYRGGRSTTAQYAEKTWQHSLATATAARMIAEALKLPSPDKFYTLGLMHEIGVSVILAAVDEADKKGANVSAELIGELVHDLHEEVGAYIARRWRMPDDFEQTVATHHKDTVDLGRQESKVLLVSEGIAAELGITHGEQNHTTERVVKAATSLGLDDVKRQEIRDATSEALSKVKNML